MEIESLPETWQVFELWEDWHCKREIKEDNDTVRKQHYFFGTKNFE